jgi:hypothetical protein
MRNTLLAACAAAGLAGCSSIASGTSQEIAVSTTPPGADCTLNRQGLSIGRISATPGAVTVQKTKYDITIVCNKDGFQQATLLDHSGVDGATFGNIILGGGIGWAIDSASGADNLYKGKVFIVMAPVGAPPPPQAVPAPVQPPPKAEHPS